MADGTPLKKAFCKGQFAVNVDLALFHFSRAVLQHLFEFRGQ
jgi:hypothetical protein